MYPDRLSRCFNLVIEVLLISSLNLSVTVITPKEFQSRNRGSFDFKEGVTFNNACLQDMFQSRNRGSFDFKNSPST